tara:strand:+ start:2994 stop:3692 length:699 start_codon:yes stop_codon:yes gene_type:complete
MQNSTIVIKMKQRINKLDSQDYDNIECWQVVESFNKAQVEWSRRQLHGINLVKEGDEQSTRRKDDLQVLLNTSDLTMTDKAYYYRAPLPADYLQWKRVDVYAKQGCCDKRRMTVYLAEEGNLNQLLRDKSKQPSFEWAETFATLINNTVHVYTNQEFDITTADLVYYRQPRKIQIQGCVDPYTGVASAINVESEFKDDIIELIIDEAVAILAGDIESGNQVSRNSESAERNN